jgi:hypothetical protein
VRDDRHFVFHQKLLGWDGSVKRGVVMVKQPGLFSPKFAATSSHVFTQSSQNVAVEPGIHCSACWYRCLALPQLLYRWRGSPQYFGYHFVSRFSSSSSFRLISNLILSFLYLVLVFPLSITSPLFILLTYASHFSFLPSFLISSFRVLSFLVFSLLPLSFSLRTNSL